MVADTKNRKTFKSQTQSVKITCRKDSPESSCQPPTASPARFISLRVERISVEQKGTQMAKKAKKIATAEEIKEVALGTILDALKSDKDFDEKSQLAMEFLNYQSRQEQQA
jgi:hypothetical protein